MEPNEPRVDDKAAGVRKEDGADFHVYCFVCDKAGAYFKLGSTGLKKITATMRKTERGYAHRDCLA